MWGAPFGGLVSAVLGWVSPSRRGVGTTDLAGVIKGQKRATVGVWARPGFRPHLELPEPEFLGFP